MTGRARGKDIASRSPPVAAPSDARGPADPTRHHRRAIAEMLAVVRRQLERRTGAREPLPAPLAGSALAMIIERCELSKFETAVLVLAIGVELDPAIGKACATAHGDPKCAWASFGLALSSFDDPHWDALTEDGALRRSRLVVLGDGGVLTQRPVFVDERVLHAILGIELVDRRIASRMLPVAGEVALAEAHETVIPRIARWLREHSGALMQLSSELPRVGVQVAARAWRHLDARTMLLDARDVPVDAAERDELARVCEREARVARVAFVMDFDGADRMQARAAADFASRLRAPIIVVGREAVEIPGRGVVRTRIPEVGFDDTLALWRRAVANVEIPEDELSRIAAQFRLDPESVHAAAAELAMNEGEPPARALWSAARAQARPRLEDLAQRIRTSGAFGRLVLPDAQLRVLRALIGQVRNKARVQYRWGFASLGERGHGTSAIFAGPSGTGKTMAAEALAEELELDLFRIDLSAVVSKYIGETEENLRRVFDAAEAGGAILLFDEADALFGKRTEVRDSHDRHANIEVSYLLQRMEAYGGLSILTTNFRKTIDDAFLRRVQFAVELPFPDQNLRERIWRGIFPAAVPLGELDFHKLAQLTVAGGNIRSIARNAAYLAADVDERVEMRHILEAARLEYVKLARALPPSEVRGWSD